MMRFSLTLVLLLSSASWAARLQNEDKMGEGCLFSACNARYVSIKHPHHFGNYTFEIGHGDNIVYKPKPNTCMQECSVATRTGGLFGGNPSCTKQLPGSEKVSATEDTNFKLCCIVQTCQESPKTTTTTTTTTRKEYTCKLGQGEKTKIIKETRDSNKKDCAAVCDSTPGCVAFDFTSDGNSGHFEEFNLVKWQHDACRLFEPNEWRTDVGLQKRSYCSTDGELEESEDEPTASVPLESEEDTVVAD